LTHSPVGTIGSLFAGIGGLELGLEAALGWETRWQVEIDPFCRGVLARHWPDADRSVTDIREAGAHNLARVDLVCGGFPCVEISSAGRKGGIYVGNSALWSEMERVVCELQPRAVVVENPADLLYRGMGRVLGDLAALGYDAEWSVLPACAVGAPHARERVFVVAYTNRGSQPTGALDAEARRVPADAVDLRHWRQPLPGTLRVADGVSGGLDRVRALGRAVVPQCAYQVGLRIRELMEAT